MKINASYTIYMLIAILLFLSIVPLLFPLSITVVMLNLIIFASLAYSINFITGMTGYVSFGHVVFMGIGAYTLAVLVKAFSLNPIITIPFAALLGSIFALGIGTVTLRFRGAYFAIATLVVELATHNVVLQTPQLGADQGLILNVGFEPDLWFYSALAILIIQVFLTFSLNSGRIGYALKAIRNEEDAAVSLGIDSPRLKIFLFSLSGLFTAATGAIFAWTTSHVYPNEVFDLTFSLQMLAMIIIGGMGTSLGPFLGSLFVYLPSYYLLTILPNGQLIVIGLAVIIMALFIPGGIVGMLRKHQGLRRLIG